MKKGDIRTIDISLSKLKTRDTGDGTMQIQGYGMLFNQPSLPMPFIEYFDPKSLDGVDFSKTLLLYGHDPNQILARADSKTLTVKVDDKGLFFTATLPDTTLGHDTYNNILAGNLRGCSVGFNIADDGDGWSQDQDGQTIHTIYQVSSLAEISITPIPAYEETSVEVKRSYSDFMKEGKKMENDKNVNENDNQTSGQDTGSTPEIDYNKLADLVAKKMENEQANTQSSNPASTRDDDSNKDDLSDTGSKNENDEEDDSTNKPTPPTPPAAPTNPTQPTNVTKKEGNNVRSLSNNMKPDNIRAFGNFLQTHKATRDISGGVGLKEGEVLIPHDILPAEHDVHQFQRLGSLVRNISVKRSTGHIPVFKENEDRLKLHTEFGSTDPNTAPTVAKINYDLKSYTGEYIFSQDLISDSDYDWQSELQGQLTTLRDNTDDAEIATALTANVTSQKADNLLDQIVNILDRQLKPKDSAAASIVLSQSAFAELDSMKDNEGRPLVQPDVTAGTGKMIKGKSVTVIDDTLFPNAKEGDINMVIAPLQKAVIKFKNNEIVGKFMDTYDIWYSRLGLYMRCDYVQARKDLINWVSSTTGATKAAVTSVNK